MGEKKYIVKLMYSDEFFSLAENCRDYFVYHSFGEYFKLVVCEKRKNQFLPVKWNEMIDNIGDLPKEEFFAKALRYTRKKLPPRLICNEHIEQVDLLNCGKFQSRDYMNSYRYLLNSRGWGTMGLRLTNTGWIGGAIAVFYPGVLRDISKIIGEDFFLTFLSLDEARIHPVSEVNAYEVHEAITNWNKITPKSLTHVYRYCAMRGELQEVTYPDW